MSQEVSIELENDLHPARVAGIAFVAVLFSHFIVDALASTVPSTLGLLEARMGLSAKQSAWLLGLGALCSGLAQPACALVSDRRESRMLGVVGIALGALGIGSLGLADGIVSLALIYALGMIGIGMYHPVGAATIGYLHRHKRSFAVSMFFVSGMLGGTMGSLVWPRLLSQPYGFRILPLVISPVVVLVVVLHRSFSRLAPNGHAVNGTTEQNIVVANWREVGLLYLSASLRFSVNLALIYLYVRWAQGEIAASNTTATRAEIAKTAAPMVGDLNAATIFGMALGGLLAGLLVRAGKEKWPMVLVPMVFAPVVVAFPHVPLSVGYLLATLAGIGFASMIPVTIALAQHALPHRTNLASSLMMGGAWATSMIGPRLAEISMSRWGLTTTFHLTAAVLVASGLVCLLLPSNDSND